VYTLPFAAVGFFALALRAASASESSFCGGWPGVAGGAWADDCCDGDCCQDEEECCGEEGDWGHLEYLDYLLRSDQQDAAWDQLGALVLGGRVFGKPYRLAAELLDEIGSSQAALYMYTRSVGCLPTEELSRPEGPLWTRDVRAGQRRLKWRLGIALDDTDLLAEIGEAEAEARGAALHEFLSQPEVIEGRLQFLARSELETAQPSWSGRVVGEDAGAYYRRIEGVHRAHMGGQIVVVRHTVQSWMAVEDAGGNARHLEELRSVATSGEGETVEWPPGRNQVCWCGSGAKYKTCCGWPPG